MDTYVKRLTQEVKSYSKDLYADRSPNGNVQIYRRATRYESYEFQGKILTVSLPLPQLVLCLTDNWLPSGKPVEWGIEPLCSKIRAIDSHRDDSYFEKMVKQREEIDSTNKQSRRNEIRAIAADMRKDFAKATNDVSVQR